MSMNKYKPGRAIKKGLLAVIEAHQRRKTWKKNKKN